MLTARTPVRSAPRTHEAISAMSAVCICTSRVAGSEIAGGLSTASSASSESSAADAAADADGSAAISQTSEGRASVRSTARRAPSAIISRATSGCRFTAPKRVMDSLTTTRSASGRNGSASAIVCWSPVISPTGAW
jgi:hypothetical protein